MTSKRKQTEFTLYPYPRNYEPNYDPNTVNYINLKECTWYQALKKACKIYPKSGFSLIKYNMRYMRYDPDGELYQITPSPLRAAERIYLYGDEESPP